MAISNGRYRGKLNGLVVLGTSSEKKTPYIEVYGVITQGENKGGRARWTGYFGPKSADRTIESLQSCGWEGDDLGEFADGQLHGLDKNEVEFVIELEEYEVDNQDTGEKEKRISPRIQFINGARGPNVQNAMPPDRALSFGEEMRGLVLKLKNRKPSPPSEAADFPHGENEKLAEEKKASGTKKGW